MVLPVALMCLLAAPADAPWRAKWIGGPGDASPPNAYVHLRRTVELPADPAEARIRVSAESAYALWVNGAPAVRGPARSDPRRKAYDEVDLAPLFRPGRNAIAVLLHHDGGVSFDGAETRAAFILDGEVACRDGARIRLDSGATWKALPARAWKVDVPRMAPALGFPEVFDARLDPPGWREVTFDDDAWPAAVEIGSPPVEPWRALVPSGIPAFVSDPSFAVATEVPRAEVFRPVAILAAGEIGSRPGQTFIDLTAHMQPRVEGVAYLLTSIRSPKAQEGIEIRAGSDDGIRLWWNGRLVISHDVEREADPEQERARVDLLEGWNQVLAKVVQVRAGWAFYFRLEGSLPEGLLYSPVQDPEAPPGPPRWFAIGPFPNPEGEAGGPRKGFEMVYPPEREQEPGFIYHTAGGRELRWTPVESMPEPARDPAVALAADGHLPLRTAAIEGRDGFPRGRRALSIRPPVEGEGARGVWALLDFGREVVARPAIRLRGVKGGEVIDLGYAEAMIGPGDAPIAPASPVIGRVKPTRGGVAYADRIICRPGETSFETFEPRAFRYLAIALRDLRAPVEIDPIALPSSGFPAREAGAFACSDPDLSRLARIAAWTVRLNLTDTITRDPWRERNQDPSDLRIAIPVASYAFGDTRAARRALILHGEAQGGDGLLPDAWPPRPGAARILEPSLHWILALEAYILHSGDEAMAKEMAPRVTRALDATSLDGGEAEADIAVRSLRAEALRAAARILEWAGDAREAKRREDEADRAKDWIPEVLPPAIATGPLDIPLPRAASLLDRLWEADEADAAIALLRANWGPMLRWGSTTCWDGWRPDGPLCRSGSAVPLRDLAARIVGARPAAPGWARARIEPHPGSLTFAQGVIPTPRGKIAVSWRRGRDRFSLDLTVPRGIEADVILDPHLVWRVSRGKAETTDRGRYRVEGPEIVRFEGE
ncbi:MAG: alpha-L-rhamnosidase N-terminal domain-containing protein [Planctomycetes bacterium]|nr:alpha-L-rhamnosidase N-terminal domain-containing protein [Planctomycetota bacterium]